MPRIESHRITIDLPDDWDLFIDNGTFVGHGPNNTEVIITSTLLSGGGPEDDYLGSLELTQNRIAGLMAHNVSRDELLITADISERMLPCGIKLTELSCVARSVGIAFDQFMLAGNQEVLFITFEGPLSDQATRSLVQAAIGSAQLA